MPPTLPPALLEAADRLTRALADLLAPDRPGPAAAADPPAPARAEFAWTAPAAPAAAATVTREGVIFEVGAYPDKDFTLTESEADAALAAFTPARLDVEHTRTIFDGKLGTIDAAWRVGPQIFGRVTLPAWVDQAWAEHGRKISCAWDRATKRLINAGLVLEPRVAQAALMAAFTAAHAAPGAPTDRQANPDPALRAGPSAAAPPPRPKEIPPMPESQTAAAAVPPPPAAPGPLASGAVEFNADVARAQLATMAAKLSALASRERTTRARSEAQRLLSEAKLLPAEQATFEAVFARALEDDEAAPVTFAVGSGSQVGRADALLALLAARPAHDLLHERLPAGVLFGLAGDGGTDADASLIKETQEYLATYAKQAAPRSVR